MDLPAKTFREHERLIIELADLDVGNFFRYYDYFEEYEVEDEEVYEFDDFVQDCGHGRKRYYLKFVTLEDIGSNLKRDYVVAVEIPSDAEIRRLKEFCRCYNHKLRGSKTRIKSNCCGCLKAYKYKPDMKVLYETRQYVNKLNNMNPLRRFVKTRRIKKI